MANTNQFSALSPLAKGCSWLIVVVLVGCGSCSSNRSHNYEASIQCGNEQRTYRVAVPPANTAPGGIIFAFHGTGESAHALAEYSGLDRLASAGFLVVYPEGKNATWSTAGNRIDVDLALFDALLLHLIDKHRVQGRPVYLVGMSQGGTFVHRVASERGNQIAGLISHSGGWEHAGDEVPSTTFRVLLIHGMDDAQIDIARSREAANYYAKAGLDVERIEVPGLGHAWAPDATRHIQQFCNE